MKSCGQCTPCREGSGWMWRMLERMAKGEATKDEVDMLGDVTNSNSRSHYLCFWRRIVLASTGSFKTF